MPVLIAEIDRLRHRYVEAIGEALLVLKLLASIDAAFGDMAHAPSVQSIYEANALANAAINQQSSAARGADDKGTVINVGGDMIRVGDISDSENIAIGKDVKQRAKRDDRFRPPAK